MYFRHVHLRRTPNTSGLQSSAQSPRDGAAGPLKLELSRALAEGSQRLKARLKILKSPSRACKPRHWKSTGTDPNSGIVGSICDCVVQLFTSFLRLSHFFRQREPNDEYNHTVSPFPAAVKNRKQRVMNDSKNVFGTRFWYLLLQGEL